MTLKSPYSVSSGPLTPTSSLSYSKFYPNSPFQASICTCICTPIFAHSEPESKAQCSFYFKLKIIHYRCLLLLLLLCRIITLLLLLFCIMFIPILWSIAILYIVVQLCIVVHHVNCITICEHH